MDHLRTLPLRFGDARIDAINNMDAGLRKDVHLREGMKLQFRVEFINLLNHPLFPGPAVNQAQLRLVWFQPRTNLTMHVEPS